MSDPAAPSGTRLRLNYRPVRRVFSVAPDDHSGFRDVIRHCTASWGGALNFIAVEERPGEWGAQTHRYLDCADLDFVTVLGADREARLRKLRQSRQLPGEAPNLTASQMPPPFGPTRIENLAAPLGELPSGLALPDFYAAAWGEVVTTPGRQTDLGYVGSYLSRWGPQDGSALARGVDGISVYGNWSFQADAALTLVPISAPNAISELAEFWNLRAVLWPFDNGVGILPLWSLDWQAPRFRTICRQGMAQHPADRRTVMIAAGPLAERGRDVARALMLASDAPTDEPRLVALPDMELRVSSGEPELPLQRVRMSGHVSEQFGFHLPDGLSTLIDAPISVDGWCAVDVLGEPRLCLPVSQAVADLVHERSRSMDDGVSVRLMPARTRSLALTIPSDRQVFDTLLDDAGFRHERSDNGRKVDQLLAALGGDLLRLPIGSREAMTSLRWLAPQRDKRLEEIDAARLPLRDLSLGELSARTSLPRERARPVLSSLVGAHVVLAGVRVRCSSCELVEWRVVDAVTTNMTCAGCLASVRFDASEPGRPGEAEWRYRLNETFSSIISQGTASTLLALAVLAREDRARFRFVTGQRLWDGSVDVGEVDALASIGDQVFVIEAKSSGIIEGGVVERLARVSERLRATAIAATSGEWDDASREKLAVARQTLGDNRFRIWDAAAVFAGAQSTGR